MGLWLDRQLPTDLGKEPFLFSTFSPLSALLGIAQRMRSVFAKYFVA
jgi:hypothetical protein